MARPARARWSGARIAGLLALVVAAICACSVGVEPQRPPGDRRDPVTAASDDAANSADDAVVALVSRGVVGCTGTVVAENVVLTAAHCVDPVAPDSVIFGTPGAPGAYSLAVIDARPHPAYDRVLLLHDVGVLLLEGPSPVTPLAIARAPSSVGAPVRIVGYGRTSAADRSAPRRRTGLGTVASIEPGIFTLVAGPSLPCEGDSGGPVFDATSRPPILLGVVSSGDGGCASTATITRLDVDLDDFLPPYVAATKRFSAAPGARCWYEGNCREATCLRPPDSPHSYCSPRCADGSPCPITMRCDGVQCLLPRPSPGAMGARCGVNDDCASFFCASGACTHLCFADDGSDCPVGWECSHAGRGDEPRRASSPSRRPHRRAGARSAPRALRRAPFRSSSRRSAPGRSPFTNAGRGRAFRR